ncbi:unknown protein [Calothrix sp. PCC 7716]|nr:unknown protein [Calothrix sp. PCC 7716]
MFDLIECSAFEISATVATLNDFFFPVVLFAVIFWVLCEIFLDVGVETQSFLIDKQFASDGNPTGKDNTQQAGDNLILENLRANMAATIEEHNTKAESFDFDTECQNLKALGARKLRDFCRNRQIKGYASAYNRRGLDGLVDFLSAKQIYAHQIEQFKHVETLAREH